MPNKGIPFLSPVGFQRAAGFCLALLLFSFASPTSSAQNDFIVQVTEERLDELKDFLLTEHGAISNVISLDATHLVCFNGNQGLKAKVRRFEGVIIVSDNPEVQWIDPAKTILLGLSEDELKRDDNSKDLSELQWGLKAIHAKEAWANSRGKGVRVAIIDNGIDADHQDLNSSINTHLSKSFVPNESWDISQSFGFNHGTHIAGIIAAADDDIGATGIAPEAELIALKVASEKTGSGDFSWLLDAIAYAAKHEVDIANIGLGVLYPKEDAIGSRATEMKKMIDVVAAFANKQGVTLIAPAGDDEKNIDDCCLYLPASSSAILSVSATAPVGWALDPSTNVEKPGSYSNTGTSSIDFAAPGGDILYPGRDYCTIANMNRPCWAFDLVFSTINDGWGWAAGSSISTAFLAGTAALLHGIEKDASPDLIKQLLIGHAIPRGKKPGDDAFYGFGFVNAFREELEIDHNHKTIEIVDGTLKETENEHLSPPTFELYQNYPNPFNPQTTINFHISKPGKVNVAVYNLMGSQVATLVDRELEIGCYNTSWNGRDETGNTLASGVYTYKIDTSSFVDAKVMTFANN